MVRLAAPRWAPAPPRVPMLAQAPENGMEPNLPLTFGLLAGAGVAFLARPQLPAGWPRSLALVAGAGLSLAGIANIFVPSVEAAPGVEPPPQIPSGPVPANRVVPTGSPSALSQVTAKFWKPELNSEVSRGLFSSDYDVTLEWDNPSGEPLSFLWDLLVIERHIGPLGGLGEPTEYTVPGSQLDGMGTGKMLLASGEKYSLRFEVDIQSSLIPFYTSGYEIRLIARKHIKENDTWVPAGNTKFFLDA